MTHTGTWTFDDTLVPIPRIRLRQPNTEEPKPEKPSTEPGSTSTPQNDPNSLVQHLLAALVPFPEARLAVTQILLRLAGLTPPFTPGSSPGTPPLTPGVSPGNPHDKPR